VKLDTDDLLHQAKRNSTRVEVYSRETGDIEVVGTLFGYTAETISVFEYSIDERCSLGLVHFIRENVDVFTVDDDQ
jgi:hypothetical protein